MKKELCFRINDERLYLECVLVEYMGIPIFFLCRSWKSFYVVQCIDEEKLIYIIVRVSEKEVYELLHGKIPMRDIISNQKKYWEVISGKDVKDDIVNELPIDKLDTSILPEEEACFEALTMEIEEYIKSFDIRVSRD